MQKDYVATYPNETIISYLLFKIRTLSLYRKRFLDMGNIRKNTKKIKQDVKSILSSRFNYLSPADKDKLLNGNDFVEVPTEELKRFRIDVYPYLM